ncbi:TlpA disulfide reductase family protein [Consotaella sp. CSK11QG-6]
MKLGAIAGLALAAGLVAGAAGIYVMESGSGNQVASCPADDSLREALDQAAQGEVAAVQPLAEPFDVSALTFKDDAGQDMKLDGYSGQSLLVNIWATWCVPCREEMPALDQLQREEGGGDFAVVPINVDLGASDKPRAFYDEIGLEALPLLTDSTMGIFNDLKGRGLAFGLPVSLLVDENGCARASINGPADWASADAVKLIDALRGKNAA